MARQFPRIRRDLTRIGVGVLQITTRARSQAEHNRRVVFVETLIERGMVECLQLLHERRVTIEQLMTAQRLGRIADLKPPREPWQLYVIARADTGDVKIGISRDVDRRFKQLEAANSGTLVLLYSGPGDREAERAAHRRFAHLHKKGEWFVDSDDIREWIAEGCPSPSGT